LGNYRPNEKLILLFIFCRCKYVLIGVHCNDVLYQGSKSGEITEVYSDSYFNTKKSYKDIQSLSRIDTTDAGREQVNAGQQVSPEYILRSDITA
jgi:hypothetical protein